MGLKNEEAFIWIGTPSSGMSFGEIDYAISGITYDICKDEGRKKELIDMIETLKRVIEKNY
jgi:hypothetical protein